MCGLFGFDYHNLHLPIEKRAIVAAILAVGNESRGDDSYSWWAPKTGIVRGLGGITNAAFKTVKEPTLMGHTRKATIGAKTIENAHAFEVGNIIGSHNGCLLNHEELNTKYNRKCQVDSEHLFYHLSENKPLTDIRGYGTIEWVQKDKPNRVYLCKLSGGDLAVAGIGKSVQKCKAVVWSSDKDHLNTALTTANLNFFMFEIKTGQVYYVEKGSLFYDGERKLELGSSAITSCYGAWNGHWDESDGTESVSMQDLFDKELEKRLDDKLLEDEPEGNNYQLWEYERKFRKEGLEKSKSDTSEFVHTHELNGEEYEEEYVKGVGWVKINNGTAIQKISG